MEHATVGRNLEHTTAATQLDWAWDLIAGGKFPEAAAFLDKAVAVDPRDARALAYMAVIAEAQDKNDETLALYRAAFALEQAHALQRGGSWSKGAALVCQGNRASGRAARSRIADPDQGPAPQQAADFYLQM